MTLTKRSTKGSPLTNAEMDANWDHCLDGANTTNGSIATAKLADGAVTGAKIADGSILFSHQANSATARIVGRASSGSGSLESLTAAQVLSLLGLGSSTETQGADLIGAPDPGGFTSFTMVGEQLQELYGILDNHGDIVSQDISTFVRKTEQEVIIHNAGGSHTGARPAQATNKTVIWFNHGSQRPTNALAFDIVTGQGFGIATVVTETGTSKTFAVGEEGSNIDMDNASPNTVTIPANADEAFTVGAVITVTQLGAGTTTVTAAAGVDLNGSTAGSVAINNQYSGVVLRKVATDEWIAQGDIT